MMQLLKVRNFSEMFTDTFQFIKLNAKHLFINMFIFSFLFILGYVVYLYYVGNLVKTEFQGFEDSNFLYIGLFIIYMIITGIIYWMFTPIYMLLYQKKANDFTHHDIGRFMLDNIGKIISFVLLSLLIGMVLSLIIVLILFVLIITIIGFLFIPFVISFFSLWFQLTLMEYLNSEKSFFDALGYAFTMLTKNFWASIGSNAIIQLIMISIYYVLVLAFGLVGAFMEYSVDPIANQDALQNFFQSPTMIILNVLMIISSIITYVNAGIVYFSQKEFIERINDKISIDEIGKNDI